MKQVRLNRLEIWIADHAAPIFIVVAALIVAGAIGITVVFLQAREAGDQVNVLKPQVTRVNKAICDAQSLNHVQRAERCAERIRYGLVNCRRSPACRAAFLAVATSPPPARGATSGATPARGGHDTSSGSPGDSEGGDASQQPSNHGSQQPGPGSQPGQPEAAPTPAPSPGPAEPSPKPETPANGPQGGSGNGSASGAGVEVCAVKTCVGAEVNVPGL